ncbi:MAG TPA: hypothetical protein VFZ17_09455 [Acidimicrobiia bacterium]|nr:hypothetical protein [Acidimicrobiia bacterium]
MTSKSSRGTRRVCGVVGSVCASALVLLAIQGSSATALSAQPVPFRASATGSYGSGGGNGVEKATHMGDGDLHTLITANLPPGFTCAPGSGVPVRFVQQVEHTAANGDQLFGRLESTGCLVIGGITHLHGTETITGGTGRFADAEGSLDVVTTLDDSTDPVNVSGQFVAERTGTIWFDV